MRVHVATAWPHIRESHISVSHKSIRIRREHEGDLAGFWGTVWPEPLLLMQHEIHPLISRKCEIRTAAFQANGVDVFHWLNSFDPFIVWTLEAFTRFLIFFWTFSAHQTSSCFCHSGTEIFSSFRRTLLDLLLMLMLLENEAFWFEMNRISWKSCVFSLKDWTFRLSLVRCFSRQRRFRLKEFTQQKRVKMSFFLNTQKEICQWGSRIHILRK